MHSFPGLPASPPPRAQPSGQGHLCGTQWRLLPAAASHVPPQPCSLPRQSQQQAPLRALILSRPLDLFPHGGKNPEKPKACVSGEPAHPPTAISDSRRSGLRHADPWPLLRALPVGHAGGTHLPSVGVRGWARRARCLCPLCPPGDAGFPSPERAAQGCTSSPSPPGDIALNIASPVPGTLRCSGCRCGSAGPGVSGREAGGRGRSPAELTRRGGEARPGFGAEGPPGPGPGPEVAAAAEDSSRAQAPGPFVLLAMFATFPPVLFSTEESRAARLSPPWDAGSAVC